MNVLSVVLIAGCVAVSSAANLRREEGPVMGYPTAGVPILPEHLDFADGVETSDFVFDVLERTPNQGQGGTVQGRESVNTPALQGQGIALSLFTVEEGGQNLIHYHPRATELLYVIKGTIEVGFTDTTGTLHANTVKAGQATVFPRALLHFQRNIGKGTSQYISMLNSENPGVMSFPRVFATLPADILAQALRTPIEDIRALQSRVVPPQLSAGGENPDYDGAAGPNGNAPVPALGGYMPAMPAGDKTKEELYQTLLAYLKK
uniref:Cupin type-1 domain-containing protein n=1 Tax=Aplanochytrium stocchinoi TaxID=215587 RepID=A0A7S3V0Y6_9STRA